MIFSIGLVCWVVGYSALYMFKQAGHLQRVYKNGWLSITGIAVAYLLSLGGAIATVGSFAFFVLNFTWKVMP